MDWECSVRKGRAISPRSRRRRSLSSPSPRRLLSRPAFSKNSSRLDSTIRTFEYDESLSWISRESLSPSASTTVFGTWVEIRFILRTRRRVITTWDRNTFWSKLKYRASHFLMKREGKDARPMNKIRGRFILSRIISRSSDMNFPRW
mgnify:CR=1 FL=1